jgi:hypothetical protein
MTDDWQKEQERQTRIAARTRERPYIRQMILIHLEMHRCDLLTLWQDILANPEKFPPGMIKQCRKMMYSRRVREMREREASERRQRGQRAS